MNDTQNYVITLKNSAEEENDSIPVAKDDNGQQILQQPNITKVSRPKFNKMAIVAPIAISKGAIASIVAPEVNRIYLRTGLETYQQRINYGVEVVNSTLSLASTLMLSGAAAGLPGVAVAGTIFALRRVVNIIQNDITLETQRNVENVQIEQYNIRAGTRGNR